MFIEDSLWANQPLSQRLRHTATKIPFLCISKKELRGLSPNFHINVSVSDLYIPRISPHILAAEYVGRLIVGIYKSLKDAWMWKLGLRHRNSFSGNICFEFSVLCPCSAAPFQLFVRVYSLLKKVLVSLKVCQHIPTRECALFKTLIFFRARLLLSLLSIYAVVDVVFVWGQRGGIFPQDWGGVFLSSIAEWAQESANFRFADNNIKKYRQIITTERKYLTHSLALALFIPYLEFSLQLWKSVRLCQNLLTINVPVFYMVRYAVVLRGANPKQGSF